MYNILQKYTTNMEESQTIIAILTCWIIGIFFIWVMTDYNISVAVGIKYSTGTLHNIQIFLESLFYRPYIF